MYFDKAILFDSKLKQAHYGRGLVKNSIKKDAESINDFNEAIKLDSLYTKAFVGRGVAKSHLGDYNAALIDYTKAIKINSGKENAVAYYNSGNMKVKLNDLVGALKDYYIAYKYGYMDAKNEIKRISK